MKYSKSMFSLGGVLCLSAVVGVADSISPSSYTATLAVGESVTITKTVTVSAGTPVSSQVDVFFLADETGSMGGAIGAVEAAAASIVGGASGLGDVAFGVGGYRDAGDSFIYRQLANMGTAASALAAIPAWTAAGGGDYPEAAMYALNQVSTTTSWRTGSERLVVWFGDAPADLVDVGGVTQASLIAELNSKGISVLAINVAPTTWDFYAGGSYGLNDRGQAAAIAAATGGTYYAGINSGSIVSTIGAAITTAVSTYTSVGIDTSEVPAGVSVSVTPAGGYAGLYDRSVDRDFTFAVTFTGVAEGTYSFDLYGTVDGGRVATESDRIVVTAGGGPSVPDAGSTVALLGLAMVGLGALRRKA